MTSKVGVEAFQANKYIVSEGNAGIIMTLYPFETGAIAQSRKIVKNQLHSNTSVGKGREREGREGSIVEQRIDLHQSNLSRRNIPQTELD